MLWSQMSWSILPLFEDGSRWILWLINVILINISQLLFNFGGGFKEGDAQTQSSPLAASICVLDIM